MDKKILLISASPYGESTQSRILDTFFSDFPKENLAQFYSRNIIPKTFKCSTYYCLSDEMILKKRFKRNAAVGNIYNSQNSIASKSEDSSLRTIGRHKTGLRYLFRQRLWGNKIWKQDSLLNWAKSFKADYIFLSVADDLYLNNIAIWLSKALNIPLILDLVDDYYFNKSTKFDLLYKIYKRRYKKQFDDLMKTSKHNFYISEKMMNKYNSHFHTSGTVLYATSTILPKRYDSQSGLSIKSFVYSGALVPGRYLSLIAFSKELKKISSDCQIHLFTNEKSKHIIKKIKKQTNVVLHEFVEYEELKKILYTFDATLIIEGVRKKDIEFNRYSLSTKTTDLICLGMPMFCYGPIESGCVSFLNENGFGFVATSRKMMAEVISKHLTISVDELTSITEKSIGFAENCDKKHNSELFKKIIN